MSTNSKAVVGKQVKLPITSLRTSGNADNLVAETDIKTVDALIKVYPDLAPYRAALEKFTFFKKSAIIENGIVVAEAQDRLTNALRHIGGANRAKSAITAIQWVTLGFKKCQQANETVYLQFDFSVGVKGEPMLDHANNPILDASGKPRNYEKDGLNMLSVTVEMGFSGIEYINDKAEAYEIAQSIAEQKQTAVKTPAVATPVNTEELVKTQERLEIAG